MATKQSEKLGEQGRLALGRYGLRILGAAATSVAGEYFCAIQALESSVVDFTSGDASNRDPDGYPTGGDTTINNLAIPAGTIIYGYLTDITVDSGNVVAYLG